ncbi:MAG TPA: hypothetical protein VJ553_05370 [Candidatus Paceibacterota bacterium]|nr:hypothetical protein [Candidatus Paceibacterota bacterium]
MGEKTARASLNLRQSICTDGPTGSDIFAFEDPEARVLANTGIERAGGVTNIYEKEATFATAGLHSLYTKSGDLLQVDGSHNVRINDSVIGNVGTCAVTARGSIPGYSDAAWTTANTIIGIVKVGSAIRVDEYNPATGTVINTRSTTFSMPQVAIINVALVKYPSMAFADNLQFILSNNVVSFLLSESGPSTTILGGQTWTSRTSASAQIWRSICWSPALGLFCAVADNGAVGVQVMTSPDGVAWTSRTSASARQWWSVCWSPALNLFCAVAADGLVATQVMTSPDGITWTSRTSASAQGWTSVCWSPALGLFCAVALDGVVGVQVMTSPDGVAWTSRTSASAQMWYSVCWSPELGMFCAVARNGAVGVQVMTSLDGVTWNSQTSAAAQQWYSVCWSPELGMFCAVSDNNLANVQIMTSPNGTVWTSRTAVSAQMWRSVCWSPELGLFCAVNNDGAVGVQVMVSSDGIIWTPQTSASAQGWTSVCWSPALHTFCAVAVNGAVGVQVMTSAQIITGTNFGWAFTGTRYIVGNQGVGSFAIGDAAGVMTAITDAKWCVIDQFAGTAYSRAILTFNVKKNAANLLTGIGEVGYTQAGVYSATPVYYGVALAAVTVTFTENVSGPGYAEATFTRSDTGTNIYYYLAPIMSHMPGLWYDYKQSQTHTLCNGYGRLTDFVGNALGNTCSLRIPMINEQPSLISAGVIGAENTLPMDCLGVPVTNVGEFDEYFVPHVVDNGSTRLNCIYRYNGVLFFFSITSGATNTLQRVSDNLYMVNCLSPINAVDVANRTLTLGANDYNGRMLLRSVAAILASSVKAVGVMQGKHANSIDTGDKLITQTFSTTTNLIPGIELPSFIDRAVPDYGVNIYLADLYSTTYRSVNVMSAIGDLADKLYISDTRIPFGMGYTFTPPVMQTEIETIFAGVGVLGATDVENDYLCYELGNQITGIFEGFLLFGQRFLFDGNQIYLAQFSGSIYTGKEPMCPAYGMVLVATSPTLIYFYSGFDNSIYTFNGGRSLEKLIRMNDIDTILQGVFNVRDNSLLLETTTTLVWVRDGVITENVKKVSQTGLGLYDTRLGIILANNTLSWQYNFSATGMTSIVALTWQSAYHGLLNNILSIATTWIITLYSATRQTAAVTLTCYSFDQDATFENTSPITIRPADWNAQGFYRCRIQPRNQLALASSVKVATAQKMAITDVSVEYTGDAFAVTAASRSK